MIITGEECAKIKTTVVYKRMEIGKRKERKHNARKIKFMQNLDINTERYLIFKALFRKRVRCLVIIIDQLTPNTRVQTVRKFRERANLTVDKNKIN